LTTLNLKRKTKRQEKVQELVTDSVFQVGQNHFPVLKVLGQFPLSLLAGEALQDLGSEILRKLRGRLCYEERT
jgi:hypothetical protein